MESASFMKVDEVAQKKKDYMVISGRVNKQYFTERTCYGADKKER